MAQDAHPFWVTDTNSPSFFFFFFFGGGSQIPWVFPDWKIGNSFSRSSLISSVAGNPDQWKHPSMPPCFRDLWWRPCVRQWRLTLFMAGKWGTGNRQFRKWALKTFFSMNGLTPPPASYAPRQYPPPLRLRLSEVKPLELNGTDYRWQVACFSTQLCCSTRLRSLATITFDIQRFYGDGDSSKVQKFMENIVKQKYKHVRLTLYNVCKANNVLQKYKIKCWSVVSTTASPLYSDSGHAYSTPGIFW